jgi:hypothetical protein
VLCVAGGCQTGSVDIISGTSASAQAFGGIMALVVQQKGRQGQANYVFYKLASSETLAACNASNLPPAAPPNASTCVFNDVTSGSTNIPGATGFNATVGYDQATGLGSVNVTNLISKWSTAISHPSATTLSLNNGTAVSITHGQPVPVSITVTGNPTVASLVPVGDVSLIASTSTSGGVDGFTLDGMGHFTGSTTLLPGSSVPYTVHAHYAGDVAFLASDSTPVSVTVNPEASKATANIVATLSNGSTTTATTVVYGSPYVLEVDVMNSAGTLCNAHATGGPACPTGTVTVKDGANSLDAGTFTLNSLGFFEDQPIQLPVGAHSIVATYAGDNSFTGSTSAADTVTVTTAATTTTVSANHTSVAAGGSVTLTATVNTQSNATASAAQEPTGVMNFFLGATPIPGGSVSVVGGVNPNTMLAQATATITVVLANGQDQITAQYAGDSNYAASAVSAPVTVSVGVPGINLTPVSNTATINISAPGQSGTQPITVSAANGFTGSVTLSCAVTSLPSGAVSPPTCSFGTSATITLSSTNTSGNATMTVATTAAQGIVFKPASRPQGPNWFLVSQAGAFIACFFLLAMAAQKRRSFVLLAMALFAVIAVGTGCGGSYGGGGGTTTPATTVGTYTVTVTATPAGATAQTTAVTVNVQ